MGNLKFHKVYYELSILIWNIYVIKNLTKCILTLLGIAAILFNYAIDPNIKG